LNFVIEENKHVHNWARKQS